MVSPRLVVHHEDISGGQQHVNLGVLRRMNIEMREKCDTFSKQRDKLRRLGHHDEADILQITVESLEYKLKSLRHEIIDLEALL